jgi:hypothetical protein
MPISRGYKYIITARERATGWLEARKMKSKEARDWISFVHREIVCRYGCTTIISDHGELDSREMQEYCQRYNIKFVPVSEYNPRANYVERGHLPLADGIMKACAQLKVGWAHNDVFYPALWADRVTINRSTGYSPYFLRFGKESILPIELSILSWCSSQLLNDWSDEEMLSFRILQISCLASHLKKAEEKANIVKGYNAKQFSKRNKVRSELLQKGDVVWLHNTRVESSHSAKLDPFWLGPYRIENVYKGGYYDICEINGALLKERITGNRLLLFKSKLHLECQSAPDTYKSYADIQDDSSGTDDSRDEYEDYEQLNVAPVDSPVIGTRKSSRLKDKQLNQA